MPRRTSANTPLRSANAIPGAAPTISSSRPAGSASSSSTPTRLQPASAIRLPTAAPGFGVLTISLSVSVVRIQLATRFDSAVANTGAPCFGSSSMPSDQYGVKPVSQVTAAGCTRLV